MFMKHVNECLKYFKLINYIYNYLMDNVYVNTYIINKNYMTVMCCDTCHNLLINRLKLMQTACTVCMKFT